MRGEGGCTEGCIRGGGGGSPDVEGLHGEGAMFR